MATKKRTTTTTPTRKPNVATAARSQAVKRLIEAYPEAWGDFLREEREKVGLTPEQTRTSRIQRFVARMQTEGVEPDVIQQALVEAGFVKGREE